MLRTVLHKHCKMVTKKYKKVGHRSTEVRNIASTRHQAPGVHGCVGACILPEGIWEWVGSKGRKGHCTLLKATTVLCDAVSERTPYWLPTQQQFPFLYSPFFFSVELMSHNKSSNAIHTLSQIWFLGLAIWFWQGFAGKSVCVCACIYLQLGKRRLKLLLTNFLFDKKKRKKDKSSW